MDDMNRIGKRVCLPRPPLVDGEYANGLVITAGDKLASSRRIAYVGDGLRMIHMHVDWCAQLTHVECVTTASHDSKHAAAALLVVVIDHREHERLHRIPCDRVRLQFQYHSLQGHVSATVVEKN